MPLATGLFRQVAIKKETTPGVAPATTLWTLLRRVSSSVDLNKDTYESNEISPNMQVSDMRHGVRRIGGTISGEVAPGAYKDIYEAMFKKVWVAGASIALAATTLAIAGSGPTYTLTRSGGSWITDGFKIGDTVRITVGAGLTASNLNKNLVISALTATVMTVYVLNQSGLATDAATATCTVAATGKRLWVPITAHTDDSYAIEHWHADVALNELFLGCKFTKADFNLPPTGLATVDVEVSGLNIQTAGARYSTTWNALNTAGLTAAVNGALLINGVFAARITGFQCSIMSPYVGDPVVGANVLPALFAQRFRASGQLTAYFEDATLRDMFVNETEASLVVVLTSNNLAASDFLSLSFPRIKVGGAAKSDGEQALVQTLPFTALYNGAGGASTTSEQTTVVMQDSLA
jgi:hypothetical protein